MNVNVTRPLNGQLKPKFVFTAFVPNKTFEPLPNTLPLASVASQLNTALGIVVV